jgi:hypothetical protein
MITALEALEEIRQTVQHNRENGEPDLRCILYAIASLKKDVEDGKTIEQIRKERNEDEE